MLLLAILSYKKLYKQFLTAGFRRLFGKILTAVLLTTKILRVYPVPDMDSKAYLQISV